MQISCNTSRAHQESALRTFEQTPSHTTPFHRRMLHPFTVACYTLSPSHATPFHHRMLHLMTPSRAVRFFCHSQNSFLGAIQKPPSLDRALYSPAAEGLMLRPPPGYALLLLQQFQGAFLGAGKKQQRHSTPFNRARGAVTHTMCCSVVCKDLTKDPN
jgi:hypothetical protein